MAIMMSATFAFGQETTGSTPTPVDNKVKVSITKNGCVCPSTGTVLSSFLWKHPSTHHFQQGTGTSFSYDKIPYTGTVEPAETFSGYAVVHVNLTIQPTNKPVGSNMASADYVQNMTITLNPKSCCPSGAECGCNLNTTE